MITHWRTVFQVPQAFYGVVQARLGWGLAWPIGAAGAMVRPRATAPDAPCRPMEKPWGRLCMAQLSTWVVDPFLLAELRDQQLASASTPPPAAAASE